MMDINEFANEINKYANMADIKLNSNQIKKFYTYMNMLIEWNEKINLTAIVEPREIIIKHFIDSLTIATYIDDSSKIIDIGTGAGFPGIPLKIYNESYNVTLLDSLNKRINFLNEVINALNLDNIETVHGRAEDFAQNSSYREKYDYAISRAVAPLNILLEYLVPYAKVNGSIIAMKGSSVNDEISQAQSAMKKLDVTIEKNEKTELPEESGNRYILVIKKEKETKKVYPRKAGTPKKNPL
ncbi:MAG: 16S rRNA (guanine(527)-N(7))-methyltransferase RsmG [Clostridia bacterium]|nr:16S rRNA (guanine(527)-N(7))-methyltransferase RsmG [Clostridia bacterium]